MPRKTNKIFRLLPLDFILSRGFTLIEILVAVGIFVMVTSIAVGFFVSAIRVQQKTFAIREVLDQTSYVIEYMSRALRMAKKDLNGICISPKLNYEKTGTGLGGIKFLNYKDECQEFFLDSGGRLKESKAGEENFLTAPNLEVFAFNIGPDDSWDQNDNDQPRVTFFLDIKTIAPRPEMMAEIQIQTTISQRNPDVMR